jgi:hypothetical protein
LGPLSLREENINQIYLLDFSSNFHQQQHYLHISILIFHIIKIIKTKRTTTSTSTTTKMHNKTDSEVTSLDASSTTRSPRRPAYYVQSPSHDGEKTTTSFHSTPVISPMGSPPHSHSSSSRFSGSRKINNHRNNKPWKEIDVIEEEGLLQNQDHHRSLSRRYYVLAFILGFFLLFTVFSLILWGASRPMKPLVTIKVKCSFL